MDPLKDAFSKIKKDIQLLNQELNEIKNTVSLLINKEREEPNLNKTNNIKFIGKKTDEQDRPTDRQLNKTPLEPFYSPKEENSIRNEGVSTDRQTDKRTIRQTDKRTIRQTEESFFLENQTNTGILPELNKIRNNTKKMVQSLTTQELTVLCKLYEFEEAGRSITYSALAKELKLTESSIRDYITRLLKKDAPFRKKKINNKQVEIVLKEDIKALIPLATLLTLRNESIRYNDYRLN